MSNITRRRSGKRTAAAWPRVPPGRARRQAGDSGAAPGYRLAAAPAL